MTTLFYSRPITAGTTNTNTDKLRQFWELDREIAWWDDNKSYKQRFHSFQYAVMRATAKQLLRQLNIL